MDIQENINAIQKKLSDIDDESKRLQGALEVLHTLQRMGVKVVNPESNDGLKNIPEDEVIDEPKGENWNDWKMQKHWHE